MVNDISPGNCELKSKDYVGQGIIIGFYKVTSYNLYNDDENRKTKKEFLERKTGDKTVTLWISKMISVDGQLNFSIFASVFMHCLSFHRGQYNTHL